MDCFLCKKEATEVEEYPDGRKLYRCETCRVAWTDGLFVDHLKKEEE